MKGLKRGENSYKSITFDRVELVAPSLGFPKSPPLKKILDPPMIQTDYARTLQCYSNKQHLMLRNAMRPNNNYLTGWLVGSSHGGVATRNSVAVKPSDWSADCGRA